jgi:hypothetical protein
MNENLENSERVANIIRDWADAKMNVKTYW